jgi:PKD repeat protein
MWTPIDSTHLDFPGQTLGQEDFYDPEWIDGSHFLVSHAGPTVTDTQTRWFVHAVGDGDDVGTGWYEPELTATGAHGVISRDGTTFAVLTDDAADHLDGVPRSVSFWVYTAPSLAAAETEGWPEHCTIGLDASDFDDIYRASPTLTPDGGALYWADDAGVERADLSHGCAGAAPTLVAPGGTQPFVSAGPVVSADPTPHQPGPVPVATARITTRHPRAHHPVSFTASAHVDGGTISAYRWSFGDGGHATGAHVRHTYRKAGTYTARLVVTSSFGSTATLSKRVRVARG